MFDFRRFIKNNRRLVSGLGMLLAILLIFWVVSSPAIVGVSASNRSLPVYSVERDDKVVANLLNTILFLVYKITR